MHLNIVCSYLQTYCREIAIIMSPKMSACNIIYYGEMCVFKLKVCVFHTISITGICMPREAHLPAFSKITANTRTALGTALAHHVWA